MSSQTTMRSLYIWSIVALASWGFVFAAERESGDSSGCSIYCVLQVQPQKIIDYNFYRNLSCTHMIYGLATIDSYHRIINPSTFDLDEPNHLGNFYKLQYMKHFDNPVQKLYLGIVDKVLDFTLYESHSVNVSRNILELLRREHFDGVFFHFEGDYAWTSNTVNFLKIFRREMKEMKKQNSVMNSDFDIVMTISARKLVAAKVVLRELAGQLNAMYLMADETHANENPTAAISVDPLRQSSNVPEEDSIYVNTAQAIMDGIPQEKLIVGLSTWARSYRLPEGVTSAHHGSKIEGVGASGTTTHRKDGKIAYHEVCKLAANAKLEYDNITETVSFVNNHTWYSVVLPHHPSLRAKIQFVAEQGFKGIGISSLTSDDQSNKCGHGVYPIHRYIASEYKCKTKRKKRDLAGTCNRMCSYKPYEGEDFDYKHFESDWCSHMIMLSADVLPTGGVKISDLVKKNIQAFEAWKTDAKPALIISVGGEQSIDTWRLAIHTPARRSITARTIMQLVNEYDLDGVDISWTLQSPDSQADSEALVKFLSELRHYLESKQLIASIHPHLTYNPRFNAETVSKSIDFFLLQGYKFHIYNSMFTGHHSPLFSNHEVLTDPKMTIEGLAFDWVSRGIPPSKLIIGLSAEGMSMYFQSLRSENDIGSPANQFRNTQNQRSNGAAGAISQTEICTMLNQNSTRTTFLESLGIPFLIQSDLFVAYDDERSIQLKAIWASLNNFGGISMHSIEMDNMHGECPAGEPFPLLRALTRAQVCNYCDNKDLIEKKVAKNTTCVPDFQVACSFKLPTNETSLKAESIPFDQCTEVVVEQGVLLPNGEVEFPVEGVDQKLEELVKLMKDKGNKPLIASIECQMKMPEFQALLDKKLNTIVETIVGRLRFYKFTGVEINCDKVLDKNYKEKFAKFITELQAKVRDLKQAKGCPGTTGIRIPVWNVGLNETYSIDLLNKLHRVVLESFQTSLNETQLVSPLFSTRKGYHLSIDTTLHAWFQQGLQREAVIMHIPAYGIMQHLIATNRAEEPTLGSETQANFISFISQKEVCSKNSHGSASKIIYDSIASYAVTPANEWVSYESQSTITYKMKYAIRESLGGVGLMTLNDDDDANVCKQGLFPLLKTIHRNICHA